MLGDLVGGLLAELLAPDFEPSPERRARRQVRRLGAGKEVHFPGTLLVAGRQPAVGAILLRPGVAHWRPFPFTDHGEVLLCRDGHITAVRPPSPREHSSTGQLVVHLSTSPHRSIAVLAPYVSVIARAFAPE